MFGSWHWSWAITKQAYRTVAPFNYLYCLSRLIQPVPRYVYGNWAVFKTLSLLCTGCLRTGFPFHGLTKGNYNHQINHHWSVASTATICDFYLHLFMLKASGWWLLNPSSALAQAPRGSQMIPGAPTHRSNSPNGARGVHCGSCGSCGTMLCGLGEINRSIIRLNGTMSIAM